MPLSLVAVFFFPALTVLRIPGPSRPPPPVSGGPSRHFPAFPGISRQRGCACHGDPGLSHIQCMVNQADYREKNGPATEMHGKAWVMCLICNGHLTGTMKQELARRPTTLCTGNMLGDSLERYEEAETVQRRVLAVTIIVSSERDGVTAWRMSSLANTLGKQRKFEEAVRLAQDSVAILRSNGATDGPN